MLCKLHNLSANSPQAWPEIPLLFWFLALPEQRQTLLLACMTCWGALRLGSASPRVMPQQSWISPRRARGQRQPCGKDEEEGGAHPSSGAPHGVGKHTATVQAQVYLLHRKAMSCKEGRAWGSSGGQAERRRFSFSFLSSWSLMTWEGRRVGLFSAGR